MRGYALSIIDRLCIPIYTHTHIYFHALIFTLRIQATYDNMRNFILQSVSEKDLVAMALSIFKEDIKAVAKAKLFHYYKTVVLQAPENVRVRDSLSRFLKPLGFFFETFLYVGDGKAI